MSILFSEHLNETLSNLYELNLSELFTLAEELAIKESYSKAWQKEAEKS